MTPVIGKETVTVIERILKQGNQAEIKIEEGKITVVEIRRKLKHKDYH
jgi:hypothetical protein